MDRRACPAGAAPGRVPGRGHALRIIAGRFGGRRISPPDDPRVRPTADRVREAWMSILGEALTGARVLDLFAGSGALGLEALSRGAASVEFVEIAPRSLTALRRNIEALDASAQVTVRRADALRHVARLPPHAYDIALADPPYSLPAAGELVRQFRAVPFARILAVEHPATQSLGGDDARRYGETTITFCYAP